MPYAKRILVIEDDEDYQQLVTAVLAGSEGEFAVETARTLAEGLAATQGFAPELILVDLNLPDSRGYDTFLRVREQADGIPIVVLTGVDDDKTALQAVEDGAQDYLVKSLIQPKLIARCVGMALSRQRRLERSGTATPPGLVLGFIGSKGGVGTSTTAMNVAAVLARNGQQTAVIELQPGPGSSSVYLQKEPPQGLYSLLEKPASEITAADVQHCLAEPLRGLHLLCPGACPGAIWPAVGAEHAQAIVSVARLICPHVVLDLPPRIDEGVAAALLLCDSIALIVDREPASVRRGAAMMEQIEAVTARTKEVRLVVVNRTILSLPMPLADVKNQLKTDPLVVILPAAGYLALSHSARTPLVLLYPDDSFSFAYIELAERLLTPTAMELAGAPSAWPAA